MLRLKINIVEQVKGFSKVIKLFLKKLCVLCVPVRESAHEK